MFVSMRFIPFKKKMVGAPSFQLKPDKNVNRECPGFQWQAMPRTVCLCYTSGYRKALSDPRKFLKLHAKLGSCSMWGEKGCQPFKTAVLPVFNVELTIVFKDKLGSQSLIAEVGRKLTHRLILSIHLKAEADCENIALINKDWNFLINQTLGR